MTKSRENDQLLAITINETVHLKDVAASANAQNTETYQSCDEQDSTLIENSTFQGNNNSLLAIEISEDLINPKLRAVLDKVNKLFTLKQFDVIIKMFEDLPQNEIDPLLHSEIGCAYAAKFNELQAKDSASSKQQAKTGSDSLTDSLEPAQSAETLAPAQSAETLEPAQSAETLAPAQSAETLEPAQSAETLEPAQSAETLAPAQSAETSQQTLKSEAKSDSENSGENLALVHAAFIHLAIAEKHHALNTKGKYWMGFTLLHLELEWKAINYCSEIVKQYPFNPVFKELLEQCNMRLSNPRWKHSFLERTTLIWQKLERFTLFAQAHNVDDSKILPFSYKLMQKALPECKVMFAKPQPNHTKSHVMVLPLVSNTTMLIPFMLTVNKFVANQERNWDIIIGQQAALPLLMPENDILLHKEDIRIKLLAPDAFKSSLLYKRNALLHKNEYSNTPKDQILLSDTLEQEQQSYPHNSSTPAKDQDGSTHKQEPNFTTDLLSKDNDALSLDNTLQAYDNEMQDQIILDLQDFMSSSKQEEANLANYSPMSKQKQKDNCSDPQDLTNKLSVKPSKRLAESIAKNLHSFVSTEHKFGSTDNLQNKRNAEHIMSCSEEKKYTMCIYYPRLAQLQMANLLHPSVKLQFLIQKYVNNLLLTINSYIGELSRIIYFARFSFIGHPQEFEQVESTSFGIHELSSQMQKLDLIPNLQPEQYFNVAPVYYSCQPLQNIDAFFRADIVAGWTTEPLLCSEYLLNTNHTINKLNSQGICPGFIVYPNIESSKNDQLQQALVNLINSMPYTKVIGAAKGLKYTYIDVLSVNGTSELFDKIQAFFGFAPFDVNIYFSPFRISPCIQIVDINQKWSNAQSQSSNGDYDYDNLTVETHNHLETDACQESLVATSPNKQENVVESEAHKQETKLKTTSNKQESLVEKPTTNLSPQNVEQSYLGEQNTQTVQHDHAKQTKSAQAKITKTKLAKSKSAQAIPTKTKLAKSKSTQAKITKAKTKTT